jgi:hypothetical protein
MTTATCPCPSCSTTSLVGVEAASLCTSCGSLSLAGTAIPLVAVVIVALAARAFFSGVSKLPRPVRASRRLAAA